MTELSEASKRKHSAALASIWASVGVTVLKLAAGAVSGSLALLSEAAHGLVDVAATTLTYFSVRAADRPADETHHYGHAKIEAVSALVETGVLVALALGVMTEGLRRRWAPAQTVDAGLYVFAVLAISIVVDLVRWRGLSRVARETGSHALAADALHFSSDLVSSMLVLVGLVALRLGFPQGDSLAAVGVALFIGVAAWRLGRRTIDTLIDRAPEGLADRLREGASAVAGVAAVQSIKLRPSGGGVQGELSIAVPRTLPLDRVVAIKADVLAALRRESPGADITITADPLALDNETVLERVLLIAALRRVAVHHVTVQDIGGVKSVSLDLEVDGRIAQGEAHRLASELEAAIRDEFGANIEVETHIEPLEVRELAGEDVEDERSQAVSDALIRHAAHVPGLRDIHDVRVRRTETGLVVNYHCHANPARAVGDVHRDVDALDRQLKREFPAIVRIVGHAEPPRA